MEQAFSGNILLSFCVAAQPVSAYKPRLSREIYDEAAAQKQSRKHITTKY